MAWSSGMVDMKKTMADKAEEVSDMRCTPAIENVADYPFGLSISLGEDELDKLGLDQSCEVGDMIDLRAFAEVTSVSKHMIGDKAHCRVELQITRMAVENESTEEVGA